MDANKNRTNQTPGDTGCLPASASPRHGFTLVEMLTVIIIIGILAGLIVAAVVPAIRRAREFTIRQDIAQLEMALEKYKQERGDFPPDFAGVGGGATPIDNTAANSLGEKARATVLQHFRKAFPRYRPGACPGCPAALQGTYPGLLYDINYATQSATSTGIPLLKSDNTPDLNYKITPAAALVLMLGGPPAPENSPQKLLGFSANPANPFARGGSRLPQLYEFDETRIHVEYAGTSDDTNDTPLSWPLYMPPHIQQASDGSKAPYVYFRPRNRDYGLLRSNGEHQLPFYCQSTEQGICTPYAEQPQFDANDNITRWKEPTKFQIICAGLDGLYRDTAPNNPVETDDVKFDCVNFDNVRFLNGDDANILPEEDDNITSFTEGKLADRAEE